MCSSDLADAKVKEILAHADGQAGGTVATPLSKVGCYGNANGTNWAVIAVLNENSGKTAWCVDSSGLSKKYTLATAGVITATEVDTTNSLCK